MPSPTELLHRWFDEVWNKGNESAIDEMMSPDAVAHGLSEGEVDTHGPEGFKPFWRNMRASFPDIHIGVEDVVTDGKSAAVRVVLEGTHKGGGLGMPPSGRHVKVGGIIFVKILDGRIHEGWNSWDQLGLLRQIGALPAPEKQDRFVAKR